MSITAHDISQHLGQISSEAPSGPAEVLNCAQDMPSRLDWPLSIATVAELLGVSTHTLRYYERIGLVRVQRDSSGYRSYDRTALARVNFITRLRMSDMPIRDIQRYVALVEEGDSSVPARLEILLNQRDRVRQQIADLQLSLAVIDYKVTTYGGNCSD
ncbi:MerR family transcriptional regulator [Saxibacter everestensis]|uniref:MerR family transcriptional regulator n=1 Tax=Saxibacter everestensis TaxID=2909229 RepID=A0ABY8QSJ0_9MICO|nr:MerR family transcriptional regulator [Brevibacteriaceae bacterium ZFBP1038]